MNIKLEDLFKHSFVLTIDDMQYQAFLKVFNFSKLPQPKKYNGFSFKYFFPNVVGQNKQYISKYLNCSYGHASIITLADLEDFPFVCIFEDDAYPCYDIKNKLEYYLTDIPDDADCLILGNIGKMLIKPNVVNKKFIIPTNYGYGSHAYVLMRKGFKKILNHYSNIDAIADHVFTSLNTYSTLKNLFIQHSIQLSMHNHLGYTWKDHSIDQILNQFPNFKNINNNNIV